MRPAGVIHDIGYQRYDGPRLGRGHLFWTLYTHSLRTAFGMGRSAKAKIFPWLVVGIIGAVAVVVTVIRAEAGEVVMTYPELPETVGLVVVLFCAVAAPELVSRDLRSGVLPLYLSRPLRRGDYPLAKLAALATAAWLPLAGAQLLMFTGAALSGERLSDVWTELADLAPALAYSAIVAIVFAGVALPVASLARRRAVAAAAVVAVFLVTTPVVGVLNAVGGETLRELSFLASPMTLVGGVGDWLFEPGGDAGIGGFGPLYGAVSVGLVAACVALLLVRYRKVA